MQYIFIINEVIQYYRNKNSDVYVCMLDASKTFVKVNYKKLFNLLYKGFFCTNPIINIKWGNQISCNVSISNGIKQGGILSFVFLTIYVDVLFIMLKDSGLGCYTGTNFMGATGYADDTTLTPASVMSLKKTLHICSGFGDTYDYTFNLSISLFLIVTLGINLMA